MPADRRTGIFTIDGANRELGIMVRVPDTSKGETNVDMTASILSNPSDTASIQWSLIIMGLQSLLSEGGFQKQMLLAGIKARGGQKALDQALEQMPELAGHMASEEPTSASDAFDMIMGAKGPDKKKMN